MKSIVLMLLVFMCRGYGQPEVIRITGTLKDETVKYFWPEKANGGMCIDTGWIYIPDGNTIYIQSRHSKDHHRDTVRIKGRDEFNIYKMHKTKHIFYLNTFWPNGRFYLYKHTPKTETNSGLVPKHGSPGRMFNLSDGRLLVSGNYRPFFRDALDLYQESASTSYMSYIKQNLKKYYLSSKSFTLTFYSDSLKLVDSLNIINRVKEDGYAFDRMWTKQAIDVDSGGTIYLIDNDQGYVVEKYASPDSEPDAIKLVNDNFKPIPRGLTEASISKLKSHPNSFSMAYALYLKNDMLVTSFHQNATGRTLPGPPYEYDITRLDGQKIASGSLAYPIITEDSGEKVFLYVLRDGGWFQDDKLYLIGLTVEDILNGSAEKHEVDLAIQQYEMQRTNGR